MNKPDHISESLETIFKVKKLFFDPEHGFRMKNIRIRDPGWKNLDPG